MSRADRIAKRRLFVAGRKEGRKVHNRQLRLALRGGIDGKTAAFMAIMRGAAAARAYVGSMLASLKMSREERQKVAELKRIRDSLAMDWRLAAPPAGPCGECGREVERRWNGVGKYPDGELLEARMLCPKCSADVEQMAQREGVRAGEV